MKRNYVKNLKFPSFESIDVIVFTEKRQEEHNYCKRYNKKHIYILELENIWIYSLKTLLTLYIWLKNITYDNTIEE